MDTYTQGTVCYINGRVLRLYQKGLSRNNQGWGLGNYWMERLRFRFAFLLRYEHLGDNLPPN
jgi:hypothetical protein